MKAKQEIKDLAKRVQKVSKELGYDMKLNHALEIVSRTHFNQTWHVVNKKDNLKLKKEKYTNQIMKDSSCPDNNIIYSGAMGTWKTNASRFFVLNKFIENSDRMRLWILDHLKGAEDYKMFDKYSQAKRLINNTDNHYMLIEKLYDELIERKKENININLLEKHLVVIEEWESFVSRPAFDFNNKYKEKGTIANKFYNLCQANDYELKVNKDLLSCFPIRNCFKNDENSSINIIGDDTAFSKINSDESGFCFKNLKESIQLPYIDGNIISNFLKIYGKENKSESITKIEI